MVELSNAMPPKMIFLRFWPRELDTNPYSIFITCIEIQFLHMLVVTSHYQVIRKYLILASEQMAATSTKLV
jgi:hypothetical protein